MYSLLKNICITYFLSILVVTGIVVSHQAAPAVSITVTTTADSGPGSLRQALVDAQAGDTIIFDQAIFSPTAPAAIQPDSTLPSLTKNDLVIDASNAGVVLDGSKAPLSTNGLIIDADNCKIWGLSIINFSSNAIILNPGVVNTRIGGDRNLGNGPHGRGNHLSNNQGNGVDLRGVGTTGNIIQGNYIGVDASGTLDQGNTLNGVAIWQGATSNTLGGIAAGFGNIISGNGENGVWIGGPGSDQNKVFGNSIGTDTSGTYAIPNNLAGVSIQDGAQENRIGGETTGQGNLISGNLSNGIYLGDDGTSDNQVLGNFIGTNATGDAVLGGYLNGVIITNGASSNRIGSPLGRNIIAANQHDGIRIEGEDTQSNTIQGNFISTDISGTVAIPNGMHGVEIAFGAHDNLIGGDQSLGEGNLLSGDGNHGLVLTTYAHHNIIQGNLIGPDSSGMIFLANHPFGGLDISDGAHDNLIGGATPGLGNVISGNPTDGVALFQSEAFPDPPLDNQLQGNLIGLAADGLTPLPNRGDGVFNATGALRTRLVGNEISHNQGNGIFNGSYATDVIVMTNILADNDEYGIEAAGCTQVTVSQNSIFSNHLGGIKSNCLAPPDISISSDLLTANGVSVSNAHLEFFSDNDFQGNQYLGSAEADAGGYFSFTPAGGFPGPNLTVTSTAPDGTTSAFSQPVRLTWTFLLYFNGDNDLQTPFAQTFNQLLAAGPSPRATVLILLDSNPEGSRPETVLYDLSEGQPTEITTSLGAGTSVPGELNMGDGQTLVDFVSWGRANYPAKYSMLAILDHGGGWAPALGDEIPGALPHKRNWMAGNSGVSWDFTADYDYLTSQELRQAMAIISADGSNPLDVFYLDVCLMGMLEVVYQVREYTKFLVSSQNIAWAPVGAQGRYVRTVHGITPGTTPRQLATKLVDAYADSLPADQHPFTVSAIESAKLPALADAVSQLSDQIAANLTTPEHIQELFSAYVASQKIDYDIDFNLEPETDGFVDLYDFAQQVIQHIGNPDVQAAADNVMSALDSAVLAEQHRSGVSWIAPGAPWILEGVHGLSVFLPLGEDLELEIVISEDPYETVLVKLRDLYTPDRLEFINQTSWENLIGEYYARVNVPSAIIDGPVDGMVFDSIPPQTTISIQSQPGIGGNIFLAWSTTDEGSGVSGAALWWQSPAGEWTQVTELQSSEKGLLPLPSDMICGYTISVRALDVAGNLESAGLEGNSFIPACSFLPILNKSPIIAKIHQ